VNTERPQTARTPPPPEGVESSGRATSTRERHQITVGGVSIDVLRRDIKHLHVGVYPPRGRVRVAAPLRLTDEAVRLALVTRLGWIRRQQAAFEAQDRQSAREMVTGESHYFQGRRYRLRVVHAPGASGVYVSSATSIVLQIPPGCDAAAREAALAAWYRKQLRAQLPALIAKWEGRIGVKVAEVRIKKMKTRWGSCNVAARRVWLNLELAKKSVACLEYILAHELAHLLERHHSERFRALMDRSMPHWRLVRQELNRAPLAHEDWAY